MKVIGLAGWSGAGKTTLLTRVIPVLQKQGLRVSVIKHAHHAFDVFPSIRSLLAVDRIGRFATWAVKQNVVSAAVAVEAGTGGREIDPTTTARTEPSPARPG